MKKLLALLFATLLCYSQVEAMNSNYYEEEESPSGTSYASDESSSSDFNVEVPPRSSSTPLEKTDFSSSSNKGPLENFLSRTPEPMTIDDDNLSSDDLISNTQDESLMDGSASSEQTSTSSMMDYSDVDDDIPLEKFKIDTGRRLHIRKNNSTLIIDGDSDMGNTAQEISCKYLKDIITDNFKFHISEIIIQNIPERYARFFWYTLCKISPEEWESLNSPLLKIINAEVSFNFDLFAKILNNPVRVNLEKKALSEEQIAWLQNYFSTKRNLE